MIEFEGFSSWFRTFEVKTIQVKAEIEQDFDDSSIVGILNCLVKFYAFVHTNDYAVPNSVSRDAMEDEYELEIVSAPSAEDIMMAVENTKDTINTFVELVSRVIEKSPKIGYAVLLLHTGVKGAEFYDKMRLSSFPGNRVRQEAEEILKGGLANFDVESYKGYKSKFNDIYREEAYALLNVIIEMLG